MKITNKHSVLTVGLALGIIWNCLCLTDLLPTSRWRFSLTIVGVGLLFTLIPLMLPAIFQKDGEGEYREQQKPGTRLFAGASLGLLVLWGASLIVCVAMS